MKRHSVWLSGMSSAMTQRFFPVTSCFWAHTVSDLIMVNCMWPPSVENYLKYWFTYITDKNT